MKSHLRYSCILCLILAGNTLLGQGIKDTVHQFHDVLVQKETSTEVVVHDKVDNTLVDFSQQEGRRMSDILSDYSGIYLKNYGIGQLSSISVNGSSAAQTDVLWNGIKLNGPTTGQVDLSLFDISSGDKLSLFTTAQNRTNGNIGLGGTLALDNKLDLGGAKNIVSNNVIRIGSFDEKIISTSNIYGIAGFKGATKLALISAANDFPFVNDTKIGAPVMHETNAATKQLSFTQQMQYTFRKPYTIGANLWITDADRQLPPVMTTDAGRERQWDQSYRTMVYLASTTSRFSFSFKSAYIYDKLKYNDPAANIDSRYAAIAFRNIFSTNYNFGQNLFLNTELHYDHEAASSTGFGIMQRRDIAGINIRASYLHQSGLDVGATIREELLGSRFLPFSPAAYIGFNGGVGYGNYLKATLTGERNYRLPALNDLYWNAGGNPNLQPEKAWKSALRIMFEHSYWLKLIADGYYNYVTDWILWHPTQTGIWMPDNVKRVLSRGATVDVRLQSKKDVTDRGFIAAGYISYSYTRTTSLDAVSINDNSKGKQLIYVPLHRATASVELRYRHFYIRSMHSYTGARFTSTDNSQSLNGYYLTHLEVGKDFYFSSQQIGLSFRINNITNTQYQMVSQRPMPGRGFEGTVRLNLAR
ncbi:MAG: hypothetical protein JWO03_2747 [Bacteroidetes bacterium]|nr:hypothetical protein [Bacteroidota bacterium]